MAAAERLVAREGFDALTVRALGRALGCDPSAIYRHFSGKTELLAALTDRVFERLERPDPAGDPAQQLLAAGRSLRHLLLEWPGAVQLFAFGPFAPGTVRLVEDLLEGLVQAGVAPGRAAEAIQAVATFAVGASLEAGSGSAGFWSGLVPADGTATPHLTATALTWERSDAERFDSGLEHLVRGLLDEV